MIRSTPVVIDAGPIIHLDEVSCLDLLDDFASLHTTVTIREEVHRHRPSLDLKKSRTLIVHDDAKYPIPSPNLMAAIEAFDLDSSEISAMLLIEKLQSSTFLCDDSAARLVAENQGYRVHGSIGIIIRAIRRGMRTRDETLATLDLIPEKSSLYIKAGLLADIRRQVVSSG